MEIRQGGKLHGTHVQVIADSAAMCHYAIRRTLWLLRAGFAPRGVNLSRFWHTTTPDKTTRPRSLTWAFSMTGVTRTELALSAWEAAVLGADRRMRPAGSDPGAEGPAASRAARLAAGPVSLIGDAFLYARANVVADGREARPEVVPRRAGTARRRPTGRLRPPRARPSCAVPGRW